MKVISLVKSFYSDNWIIFLKSKLLTMDNKDTDTDKKKSFGKKNDMPNKFNLEKTIVLPRTASAAKLKSEKISSATTENAGEIEENPNPSVEHNKDNALDNIDSDALVKNEPVGIKDEIEKKVIVGAGVAPGEEPAQVELKNETGISQNVIEKIENESGEKVLETLNLNGSFVPKNEEVTSDIDKSDIDKKETGKLHNTEDESKKNDGLAHGMTPVPDSELLNSEVQGGILSQSDKLKKEESKASGNLIKTLKLKVPNPGKKNGSISEKVNKKDGAEALDIKSELDDDKGSVLNIKPASEIKLKSSSSRVSGTSLKLSSKGLDAKTSANQAGVSKLKVPNLKRNSEKNDNSSGEPALSKSENTLKLKRSVDAEKTLSLKTVKKDLESKKKKTVFNTEIVADEDVIKLRTPALKEEEFDPLSTQTIKIKSVSVNPAKSIKIPLSGSDTVSATVKIEDAAINENKIDNKLSVEDDSSSTATLPGDLISEENLDATVKLPSLDLKSDEQESEISAGLFNEADISDESDQKSVSKLEESENDKVSEIGDLESALGDLSILREKKIQKAISKENKKPEHVEVVHETKITQNKKVSTVVIALASATLFFLIILLYLMLTSYLSIL
jgi:hypothetical protein